MNPAVGAALVAALVLAGLWAPRKLMILAGQAAEFGGGESSTPTRSWTELAATVSDAIDRRGGGWIGRQRSRRLRRLAVESLPELTAAVARSLSGGASLAVALSDGARVVGPPLEDDIGLLLRRVDAGLPLRSALDRWISTSGSEEVAAFATAFALGAELGRGSAAGLDGVAAGLSARRDLMAEARATSSQARASAALLTALPIVVVIGLGAVDQATLSVLVGTPLGLMCLAAAVGLDAVGLWWMRRMIGSVS